VLLIIFLNFWKENFIANILCFISLLILCLENEVIKRLLWPLNEPYACSEGQDITHLLAGIWGTLVFFTNPGSNAGAQIEPLTVQSLDWILSQVNCTVKPGNPRYPYFFDFLNRLQKLEMEKVVLFIWKLRTSTSWTPYFRVFLDLILS